MSSRKGPELSPAMVAAVLPLALQLLGVILWSSQSVYRGPHLLLEPEPVNWRFGLFVLICAVFTALEALVLYRVGKGDEVPLLTPVGLELALDARLPVTQLRRLLAVGSRAGLARLDLVAAELPEPSASKPPPGPEAGPPFLVRVAMTLVARPYVAEVLLPATLEALHFEPHSWWVAELDARPQVPLSLLLAAHEGPEKSWVLDLRAPDRQPDETVSRPAVLHLIVTERAATEDVAHAVRKARALGFHVLLSTGPPPPLDELPLQGPARP